jgi:hypothetical protein
VCGLVWEGKRIRCRRTTVSSSGVHLIGMVAVVAVDAVKVVRGCCAMRCKRNLRLVCCGCAAKPCLEDGW